MDTTGRSACVGQFGLGAAEEVQAWICEHDGHPFIELHLQQHGAHGETPPSDTVIRIPATLLTELKRLVHGLEEQLTARGLSDEFQTVEQLHADRGPIFAHPSEAEFARMLDFYQIRWQYESTTFPLQWDAHGRVLESFTPDFSSPGAGPLYRADHPETRAGHQEEPQGPAIAAALSGGQHQALPIGGMWNACGSTTALRHKKTLGISSLPKILQGISPGFRCASGVVDVVTIVLTSLLTFGILRDPDTLGSLSTPRVNGNIILPACHVKEEGK